MTKPVVLGAFLGAMIVACFGLYFGYSIGGHHGHGRATHGDAIFIALIFTMIFAIPAAILGALTGAMLYRFRRNRERLKTQVDGFSDENSIEQDGEWSDKDAIQ